MKKILVIVNFIFLFSTVQAQRPTEHVTVNWPPEYEWKVLNRQNQGGQSTLTIIPGAETIQNATIVGVMGAYQGMTTADITQMVAFFRSGLDSGSVLTLLDSAATAPHRWVIFKVETPKTVKYPEPESDLYYCVQGDFALFENHVAIKQSKLTPAFEQKWILIFKQSIISK